MQSHIYKGLGFVVGAVLAVSLMTVRPAGAQNVLSLGGAMAAPGANVQLDISLSVDQNLSSLAFDITFDAGSSPPVPVNKSGSRRSASPGLGVYRRSSNGMLIELALSP
jgi:hypothetical protein